MFCSECPEKGIFVADIPSTTGFLDVQGAPLYYEVAGQGLALLLIHQAVSQYGSGVREQREPGFYGLTPSQMGSQHFYPPNSR